MSDPRPEKVAVVAEVREKFESSSAVMLTEYRGLDVPAMAKLRAAMREAGGEYKIYKNTLALRAVNELGLTEIAEHFTGPTALAFVQPGPDGDSADPLGLAKALADFAKDNDALVIKGGLLDDALLSEADIKALALVPPRDVLLAQFAAGLASPMQRFAGLLSALPRNFAYGLGALIEKGGGPDAAPDAPAAAAEEAPAEATEAPAEEAAAEPTEAPATELASDVAAADETAAPEEAPASEEAADEPEAPAEDSATDTEASADESSETSASADEPETETEES